MAESIAVRNTESSSQATGGTTRDRGEGGGEDVEKSRWPLSFSLGLLGTLVTLYFFWPAFQEHANEGYRALQSGDQQRVSAWVQQFDPWGPVVVIVAMTAQMFLIIVPSVILLVVSVIAYGAFWGSLLGVGSVLVASSVGYWVGAALGPMTVNRLIGQKRRDKLEDYIERYGVWTVVVFRMSPVLSNDAISFVGGLLTMGFWRFVGATALGILPLVALIAYFGESVDQMRSILLWLSGVSAVALVAYVVYDRKRLGSRHSS